MLVLRYKGAWRGDLYGALEHSRRSETQRLRPRIQASRVVAAWPPPVCRRQPGQPEGHAWCWPRAPFHSKGVRPWFQRRSHAMAIGGKRRTRNTDGSVTSRQMPCSGRERTSLVVVARAYVLVLVLTQSRAPCYQPTRDVHGITASAMHHGELLLGERIVVRDTV